MCFCQHFRDPGEIMWKMWAEIMSYLLAQTIMLYHSHRFSNMQPHYSQGNVQKALGAPRVCGNTSGLTLSWLPGSTAERPFCQHQEPGCWVWYCRPMRNIIRIQDGSLENRDILGVSLDNNLKSTFGSSWYSLLDQGPRQIYSILSFSQ